MNKLLTKIEKNFYLLFWVAVFNIAFLALPYLPQEILRKHLWGIYHFRDFPLTVRISLSLVSISLCFKRINEGVWNILKTIFIATPRGLGRTRRLTVYFLISLLFFPAFWFLRTGNYTLGDSIHLIEILTWDVHIRGYHITFDEPLELYIHSIVYNLLHNLLDWDVSKSYALISAICGVAFIFILLLICDSLTKDRTKRFIIFAFVLSMGSMQLFFGSVENYTIVATGAMLYVLLAYYCLKDRCSIVWPSVTLSISFCMHVLAGWLFPSLLYLYVVKVRQKSYKEKLLRFVAMSLSVLLPIGLTVAYLAYIGYGPENIKYTHLARMKFIPLLDKSYIFYQYSMFSANHITDILNEIVLIAAPGLMILPFIFLFHHRGVDYRDNFFWFLAGVTFFSQVFAASWNPDLGAYEDWDLFSIMGIGYAILGAYLLINCISDGRKMEYIALMFIMISAIHGWTWIVSNAMKVVLVDSHHSGVHVAVGNKYLNKGEIEKAIEEYKEALRADSDNVSAHLNLGISCLRRGRGKEALFHFEETLRLAPNHRKAVQIRSAIAKLKDDIDMRR